MSPDNPANEECKQNKQYKLHYWSFHLDGTATCALCAVELTKEQADEIKRKKLEVLIK